MSDNVIEYDFRKRDEEPAQFLCNVSFSFEMGHFQAFIHNFDDDDGLTVVDRMLRFAEAAEMFADKMRDNAAALS